VNPVKFDNNSYIRFIELLYGVQERLPIDFSDVFDSNALPTMGDFTF